MDTWFWSLVEQENNQTSSQQVKVVYKYIVLCCNDTDTGYQYGIPIRYYDTPTEKF